ncbi:albusnodin/ikarugamycin family macrolactam cyclase [Streptomyces sp. MP131-18]|uniref:albusnodin/ikarugamycin family macrolactam cyclase n=1 Tax=Streptomyces sp. MP131-18 TaxID=1857892 RepID=UPI00097C2755|nr:albusnodin/ikarugamycin family macrolactam cyclase [Streptomyces sp. MP131-18]ONK13225.1 Carboxyethyl-arginine beta-lactam-synthase [Streptomyces sp. MP131-18]
MAFGGFSAARGAFPRPKGAAPLAPPVSSVWQLGDAPARQIEAPSRRLMLLGWCGASTDELRRAAEAPALPTDVAWRWPGTYTAVEETADRVVLHTDPADAAPVYATRWGDGWAWSTSARLLARLTAASVDVERLACSILAPSVPALAETRSFFSGVQHLPAGSRIELPADGSGPYCSTRWRPDPVPGPPDHRLREALAAAVAFRVDAGPDLSSDLSGGLDSTSLTVLAATCRPRPQPLTAVTMHPDGDDSAADLRYARLTQEYHRDRIDHQVLPVTAEHLPYSDLTAVPASDEPAPSTLSHVQLIRQMRFVHQTGSRLHLTGDGGDSVMGMPPVHLADLIRKGRWLRAVTEAVGLARLRHRPLAPLLREAAALARTGRRDALAALSPMLSCSLGHGPHLGDLSWFSLSPAPSWARPETLRLVAGAALGAAERDEELPGTDIAVRTLVDEIRETARSAVADAALAASVGVDLHNPFLDGLLVDAVLRTSIDHRPAVHAYKPVLRRAMAPWLPPALARRTTKDSATASHYAGLRANLSVLMELADGRLAALGLLDPPQLRRHLREAAAGIPTSLGPVEQALSAEAWLHAHHTHPAPAWTDAPVGSVR